MIAMSLLDGDHRRAKDDLEEGLAAQVSGSRSSTERYRKPTLLQLAAAWMILLFMMSGLRSVTPAVFLKAFFLWRTLLSEGNEKSPDPLHSTFRTQDTLGRTG